MSSEYQIHGGSSAPSAADSGGGTNIERLQALRNQAAGFEAVAARAFASAQHRVTPSRDILESIRQNRSGQ